MQWGDCFHNISYNSSYWSPLLLDLYTQLHSGSFGQVRKPQTSLSHYAQFMTQDRLYKTHRHFFYLQQEQEKGTCSIFLNKTIKTVI